MLSNNQELITIMLFNKQLNIHPLRSMACLLPSILFVFVLGGLAKHLISGWFWT